MVGRLKKHTLYDPLLSDTIIDDALYCVTGKRSPAEREYFPKMNKLLDMLDKKKITNVEFDRRWNKLEKALYSDPRQVKYRKALKKKIGAKSHTSTLHTRSW